MVRRTEEIVFPFLAQKIPGTKNFRWAEVLYLNEWDIFVIGGFSANICNI